MPDTGSAPNKVFIRTDGTRTGADVFAQEAAIFFGIQPASLDTEAQDMAVALSNRLMVDGGTQPTADLPMNSFHHTGVSNATARTHYAAFGQVQDGAATFATTAGNDTITATLTPAITAYATGQLFLHKAGGTNTGAATLNENAVGAKTIKKGKASSLDLSAGDFAAGKMGLFAYDGTNMVMLNAAEFPSGTRLIFQQTAAPVGWTKDATHNDKALRVVSGSVVNGGSVAFTTAFASQTPTGTVGNTTLTLAQIPSHTHDGNPMGDNNADFTAPPSASNGALSGGSFNTTAAGGGGSHTHTFTGNAINLAVAYCDVIFAQKD